MYLFSRMFTLSYYCPFIDFISSTHGTVLLLKNYNGNKTKNVLTMVSTDLLITWPKRISTMVVISSFLNSYYWRLNGYTIVAYSPPRIIYEIVKLKREIQKPSYDFYRNWNAIIILPCIYIWVCTNNNLY